VEHRRTQPAIATLDQRGTHFRLTGPRRRLRRRGHHPGPRPARLRRPRRRLLTHRHRPSPHRRDPACGVRRVRRRRYHHLHRSRPALRHHHRQHPVPLAASRETVGLPHCHRPRRPPGRGAARAGFRPTLPATARLRTERGDRGRVARGRQPHWEVDSIEPSTIHAWTAPAFTAEIDRDQLGRARFPAFLLRAHHPG